MRVLVRSRGGGGRGAAAGGARAAAAGGARRGTARTRSSTPSRLRSRAQAAAPNLLYTLLPVVRSWGRKASTAPAAAALRRPRWLALLALLALLVPGRT